MPNPKLSAATAADLGAQVRQRRKELHLDQHEVALAAGVSRRTVHAVESGKATVRLDALVSVLRAVGLDLVASPRLPGMR